MVLSGFLHQYNWPLRFYWNTVESGVKHHNSNPLHVCGCPPLWLGWSISLCSLPLTVDRIWLCGLPTYYYMFVYFYSTDKLYILFFVLLFILFSVTMLAIFFFFFSYYFVSCNFLNQNGPQKDDSYVYYCPGVK